jgi:hypothetical protein
MGNKNSTLSRLLLFVCTIVLFIAGKYCTSKVKEVNSQKYYKEANEAFAQIERVKSISSEKESETWDYDGLLTEEVERFNKKLPQKVDEVSLWDSYTLEEDALTYHYIIDDKKVDMNKIDIEIIKENMLKDYKKHYNEMIISIEGCIATNRCIRYRYTGETTKKELEFLLLPSELQSIRP